MKFQHKIKNKRQVSASVMGRIREVVERESERWQVSKSFVIAVALADYFGIKEQEKY